MAEEYNLPTLNADRAKVWYLLAAGNSVIFGVDNGRV